jgi:hypothetical protein
MILLRDIQLTHVQRSEVQLWKICFLTNFCTLNEANTLVALPNAWRRSVRALSFCYHNNNGSQSTVDKTVDLRWVVYRVAEPSKCPLNHTSMKPASSLKDHILTCMNKFLAGRTLSRPAWSCRDLRDPVLTCVIQSWPAETCPDLQDPILTCRILSWPAGSYPEDPILTCRILSWPAGSYPDLQDPILTCRILSWPAEPYPDLKASHPDLHSSYNDLQNPILTSKTQSKLTCMRLPSAPLILGSAISPV